MTLGVALLFLHIATIFAAVTVSFGSGLVMRLAYLTGRLEAVRGVALASRPVGVLIPILFVAGGLFGLLTTVAFGYNLLAPWLVIAYVLWLVAMAEGAVVNRDFAQRLQPLLAGSADGPITSPIVSLFSEPKVLAGTVVDYVVVIALVFDMVVKPFS